MTVLVALSREWRDREQSRAKQSKAKQSKAERSGAEQTGVTTDDEEEAELRGVYLCLDGRVHTSHPVVYAPLHRSLTLSPSVFLSLYLLVFLLASLSFSAPAVAQQVTCRAIYFGQIFRSFRNIPINTP